MSAVSPSRMVDSTGTGSSLSQRRRGPVPGPARPCVVLAAQPWQRPDQPGPRHPPRRRGRGPGPLRNPLTADGHGDYGGYGDGLPDATTGSPGENGSPGAAWQLRGAENAAPSPFSPRTLELPPSVNPLRYGPVLPTAP
ncbi:hypothetical protein OG911_22540 [Streptomyces sp. NBC_00208]|uniref:hypothetical protein n=1 Tax=Streptomyces sp. NBC_00208 TaxID=2975681 RepID=UPI002E284713|nr:hypothetical protein [Streptomyces sp. NBC_00208]